MGHGKGARLICPIIVWMGSKTWEARFAHLLIISMILLCKSLYWLDKCSSAVIFRSQISPNKLYAQLLKVLKYYPGDHTARKLPTCNIYMLSYFSPYWEFVDSARLRN